MTDVQSQKSAEELPDMQHPPTGLLTALIEYLSVLLEYLDLLQFR